MATIVSIHSFRGGAALGPCDAYVHLRPARSMSAGVRSGRRRRGTSSSELPLRSRASIRSNGWKSRPPGSSAAIALPTSFRCLSSVPAARELASMLLLAPARVAFRGRRVRSASRSPSSPRSRLAPGSVRSSPSRDGRRFPPRRRGGSSRSPHAPRLGCISFASGLLTDELVERERKLARSDVRHEKLRRR